MTDKELTKEELLKKLEELEQEEEFVTIREINKTIKDIINEQKKKEKN